MFALIGSCVVFHELLFQHYLFLLTHTYIFLFSSIDLSNIAAAVYSTELCSRLRGFLTAWPASSPLPHVNELLIAVADFERHLELWNIRLPEKTFKSLTFCTLIKTSL